MSFQTTSRGQRYIHLQAAWKCIRQCGSNVQMSSPKMSWPASATEWQLRVSACVCLECRRKSVERSWSGLCMFCLIFFGLVDADSNIFLSAMGWRFRNHPVAGTVRVSRHRDLVLVSKSALPDCEKGEIEVWNSKATDFAQSQTKSNIDIAWQHAWGSA